MKKIIILLISIFLTIGVCLYFFNTSSSDNSSYKEITYEDYLNKIKNKESFTVYMFKPDCIACEQLKPTLNNFIDENHLNIYALQMGKYIDKYKDDLVNKKLDSTPTLIRYNKGKEVKRLEHEVITTTKLKKLVN